MIWRTAWRNLWRNRTRTIITGSAVGSMYGLMLVGMSLGDDAHARMLLEAARAAGGDVIVHAEGYWDARASDLVMPDADQLVERVAAVPGVETAMPRILAQGLAGTSADTRPMLLLAVDSLRESAMSDLGEDLVAGAFTSQRSSPIVLGSRLTEKLDAELDDRIIVTAAGPDGEVTRALFYLSGVIETGAREMDEMIAYTTVDAARRALGMPGMLTQIGVLAENGVDVRDLAAAVSAELGGEQAGLEVLDWAEAVPEMVGFVELDDRLSYVYLMVIFGVVLLSVTNTFLMSVMERVRELGLLSALGLNGPRIAHMMFAEAIVLTALAMGGGFLLGYGIHLWVSDSGISLAIYGLEEMEISGIDFADMVMYSTINPIKWAVASAAVATATVMAAAYPAYRATRLAPAEAMRFYE